MQDNEGTTVPKAAVLRDIPRQSAYRLLKDFDNSNGSVLPGFAPKAKNRASLYNRERDAERTLRLSHKVVSKWKKIGVYFRKNCIFEDEAGFNTI
ncbi:hypothetical protein INT47_000808 [Mucor saturninus]|uniref:Uncharacterized protein n=1 Tax=Mucor saturninus TaxID=64648 RepID=A0A8H7VCZ0_9FUNG|nr:hypothetical protein INT47_000808 [Mucor saturninus]